MPTTTTTTTTTTTKTETVTTATATTTTAATTTTTTIAITITLTTTASATPTSSPTKTAATDTIAVTTTPATSTADTMLPTNPDNAVDETGEANNDDMYNESGASIVDKSDNATANGSISAPPTEPQKSSSSTSTIVGVLVTLILAVAVVGFILWRQEHHATGGGGIPHIVGQNGGVGGDVLPIYHNRMYNIDTSPSKVYLQPNALQPAWYDSQPGRCSTVSATEAGVVYAIPVDLKDGEGSGGNTASNGYAMPLANYAVVGTGSSATTNGGGGGGNHEYSIPEARSRAAPLLPLDLDGYVVDDTAPAEAGAAPGGVVYATPAADSTDI